MTKKRENLFVWNDTIQQMHIDDLFKRALTGKLNQRQDSLNDQLADLILVANKLKMYDAADYLKSILNQT